MRQNWIPFLTFFLRRIYTQQKQGISRRTARITQGLARGEIRGAAHEERGQLPWITTRTAFRGDDIVDDERRETETKSERKEDRGS